jgi:flagellar basal-body rod protein FlgB
MHLLFPLMLAHGLLTIGANRSPGHWASLQDFFEGPCMQNRLTQALDFQSQALVLRAERQRLIASNIANADTPGYQAREMDFANALRQATGTTVPSGARLPMATTHSGHEPATLNLREDNGLLYARHSQDAIDRNTVDMDRERASFTDNTVKYEATLRFINGSVRSMLDAMRSHNQ